MNRPPNITRYFNMRKICAKMVAKNLNDDQKERQIEVSAEMLIQSPKSRFK
jgi:hypothetical protein